MVRKRFVVIILSSVLSLGIFGIVWSTVGFTTSTQGTQPIDATAMSKPVPHPSLGQGAQANSDLGFDLPYQEKLGDAGIVSAMKPAKSLDKGIILQYPNTSVPPDAQPTKPKQATPNAQSSKNSSN